MVASLYDLTNFSNGIWFDLDNRAFNTKEQAYDRAKKSYPKAKVIFANKKDFNNTRLSAYTNESAQKNEGIEEQQDAIAKKIADAVSAKFGWVLSKEGPYEEYYIGKGLNPINVKIKNDKDLQVQLRASAQPKAFKSVKDAIDFIKSNMNAYGFPGASAFYGKLQSKANKNVERQKARDTYLHDISDSAQINETRGYKVLVELGVPDNMNNRDIEDEVERLLRTSNKIDVVIDVTAERK